MITLVAIIIAHIVMGWFSYGLLTGIARSLIWFSNLSVSLTGKFLFSKKKQITEGNYREAPKRKHCGQIFHGEEV